MEEIYRVENNKGESCYSFKYVDAIGKLINDMNWFEENEQRPFPKWDNGIDREIKREEICGFKNLQQVFKWFNKKELKNIKRLGFKLTKIKVERITAVGDHQILAIR